MVECSVHDVGLIIRSYEGIIYPESDWSCSQEMIINHSYFGDTTMKCDSLSRVSYDIVTLLCNVSSARLRYFILLIAHSNDCYET